MQTAVILTRLRGYTHNTRIEKGPNMQSGATQLTKNEQHKDNHLSYRTVRSKYHRGGVKSVLSAPYVQLRFQYNPQHIQEKYTVEPQ